MTSSFIILSQHVPEILRRWIYQKIMGLRSFRSRRKASGFLCQTHLNRQSLYSWMSTLIYVDTNVYMDHALDRSDRFAPLGEFAAQVFKRSRSCEFTILVSDWVLEELRVQGCLQSVNVLLSRMRQMNKIVDVNVTAADESLARQLNTHYQDALHIAVAIRCHADIIVTNNTRDFQGLSDRIPCVSPRFL